MTHSVERLKLRDTDAWNSFYDEFLNSVYGFVFRLVRGNREVADELFQEVWLLAIENIDAYDLEKGDLSAWLFGIGRRRVALYWRRTLSHRDGNEGRDGPQTVDPVDATLLPIEVMLQLERAEIVNAALLTMSNDHQRVLMLKYIEGFSVAEIAERSGVSAKATESLLSRARDRLRTLLGPVFSKKSVHAPSIEPGK